MIHLDTNYLIRCLTSGSAEQVQLGAWVNTSGIQLNVSAVALAEFLCGPATPAQRRDADALFPRPEPFIAPDADVAAQLFNGTGRRRGTMVDCMIAAIAIRTGARMATGNLAHFARFVPFGLVLV